MYGLCCIMPLCVWICIYKTLIQYLYTHTYISCVEKNIYSVVDNSKQYDYGGVFFSPYCFSVLLSSL